MNFHGAVVKAAYKRKQCTAEIKEKRKTVDTSKKIKIEINFALLP